MLLGAHRPLYVPFPHKSNRLVGEHLRGHIEGLLSDYQVDLVVSGHVHSYSRTCNVRAGRCLRPERGGTVHLTVGCAGRKLSDVEHDQPEWLEAADVRYGYGRVTVEGGDSLLFEYVSSEGEAGAFVRMRGAPPRGLGCSCCACFMMIPSMQRGFVFDAPALPACLQTAE